MQKWMSHKAHLVRCCEEAVCASCCVGCASEACRRQPNVGSDSNSNTSNMLIDCVSILIVHVNSCALQKKCPTTTRSLSLHSRL